MYRSEAVDALRVVTGEAHDLRRSLHRATDVDLEQYLRTLPDKAKVEVSGSYKDGLSPVRASGPWVRSAVECQCAPAFIPRP